MSPRGKGARRRLRQWRFFRRRWSRWWAGLFERLDRSASHPTPTSVETAETEPIRRPAQPMWAGLGAALARAWHAVWGALTAGWVSIGAGLAPMHVVVPLIFGVCGAGFGVLMARAEGSHFIAPVALDTGTWHVISPGMDGALVSPELGRGTFIVDGALMVTEHVFFMSDKISLKDTRPFERYEMELADNSDAVRLTVLSQDHAQMRPIRIDIEPNRFNPEPITDEWVSHDGGGHYVLEVDGQGTWIEAGGQRTQVGPVVPGFIEFNAEGGAARILRIAASVQGGETVVDQRFDEEVVPVHIWQAGGVLGMAAGMALWLIWVGSRGRFGQVAGLGAFVLPVLVSRVPSATWLAGVEQLYLVQTAAWDLAGWVVLFSMVPLVVGALAGTGIGRGLATADGDGKAQRVALGVGVGLCLGIAAWAHAPGTSVLWTVFGLFFLCQPLVLAKRSGISVVGQLGRDVPALLSIGLGGWGFGFFCAVLWRLGVMLSSARELLQRAPRPASDAVLILLVCLPVALETTLRGTYLNDAWQPESLTLEVGGGADDPLPQAGWVGNCGPEDGENPLRVVFSGGSSTGGDQQFGDDRSAFFAGRTHHRICQVMPGEQRLTTSNYGRGALDSHVISRTLSQVLDQSDPHLVVLYLGVNDLLSQYQTLTRKQREEYVAAWRDDLSGVRAFVTRSRLLIGGGLLARKGQGKDAVLVSNVPVEDAAENLAQIAQSTAAHGSELLLLTEYVRQDLLQTVFRVEEEFTAYADVQRSLAAKWDHVHYLDVWPAMKAEKDVDLLVDSNHMTRFGNDFLSSLVAPEVANLLGVTEPPSTAVKRPAANVEAATDSPPPL